ncbi:MAG: type II toxin-antitoxin system RelE/ParE family toxin [Verrucomicrobiota bacterium JB022]|nr:type II toxin-antitoxin system RelE/ParE family toxin [Verrucomicrobiota bacterium JB022]
MKIRILEEARADLLEGYRFYEFREPKLGDYFLNTLYSDIDRLNHIAGVHRLKAGFHWMLSRRFPYAIYYRVEDGVVSIYAVIDCRRDPDRIGRQLNRRGSGA